MTIIDFPEQFEETQQKTVANEIREARQGRLPDLFRIMLHSPEVTRGWLALGTAIRYRSSLGDAVRETLITYVAQARGCSHEIAAHTPLAEAAGVPVTALADLADWQSFSGLSDELCIALALAEPATEGLTPSAEAVAAAVEVFGERGVVEIVALVAYYSAIALFMDGIGLNGHPD